MKNLPVKRNVFLTCLLTIAVLTLALNCKKDETKDCFRGTVEALKTWELPSELLEISAITWVGNDRIAAVQDNDGIIYIYNLSTENVEERINFGPKGDYEALAYADNNYFVMRADGYMYEVNAQGTVLNEYDLPFTVEDDIESLYFDALNHRLLIGQKEGRKDLKAKFVYSFDLRLRQFTTAPVYTINLSDPVFECISEGKKKAPEFKPSDITLNPGTGQFYVADGPNQRVLVLSPEGKPEYFLKLDEILFPQAEGMLFAPNGDFYISSEGKTGPGKISKVNIKLH